MKEGLPESLKGFISGILSFHLFWINYKSFSSSQKNSSYLIIKTLTFIGLVALYVLLILGPATHILLVIPLVTNLFSLLYVYVIGKERTSKLRKIITSVILIVFIFLLIFNPYTFFYYNKIVEPIASCEGIEKYYTGTGFESDYEVLQSFYQEHASSYTGTLFNTGIHIYPRTPSSLGDGGHFDCNDISHAVICLAEKYDMGCDSVFWLFTPGNFPLNLHYTTICDNGHHYDGGVFFE